MPQVLVDANTCTGCGICARVCPVTVFDVHDSKAVATRVATCMACELCVVECPWRAISVDRLAPAAAVARPSPAVPIEPRAPAVAAAAVASGVAVTYGVEALPGVQPYQATPPAAPASVIPIASPSVPFNAPGVIVPQTGSSSPAGVSDSPSFDRALVARTQPQAPVERSPSSLLPVPDSFPYIIVKKGSPESSGE